MRNVLTATDALVLSPVDWPERPGEVADVHDAFVRAVTGMQEDRVVFCWEDGQPLVAHRDAPELMFRMTPVLRDGATVPYLVPDAWRGQVTRAVVASYFAAGWLLYQCDPGWGAHLPFGQIRKVEDGLDVDIAIAGWDASSSNSWRSIVDRSDGGGLL